MGRQVASEGPVATSGCQLEWMRRHGMWSAADEAIILARYGPTAFDDHWWCCVARPWDHDSHFLCDTYVECIRHLRKVRLNE